jgi:hypothetical protein
LAIDVGFGAGVATGAAVRVGGFVIGTAVVANPIYAGAGLGQLPLVLNFFALVRQIELHVLTAWRAAL